MTRVPVVGAGDGASRRSVVRRSVRGRFLGMLAAAVLAVACSDPEVTTPDPAATDTAPDGTVSDAAEPGPVAEVPDPRGAVLDAAAEAMRATLTDARQGFETLSRATSISADRATALRVRAVLAADPRWQDLDGDGTADDLGVRPLLPGPIQSREETIDYGDAFTEVLTAGRDAGAAGADWIDVLRDPVVSDLGAWQRDSEGLLLGIELAVRDLDDGTPLPDVERGVSEIAGEGPRALAWALLAVETDDLARLQAYGERGVVHVDVMLDAVTLLLEDR